MSFTYYDDELELASELEEHPVRFRRVDVSGDYIRDSIDDFGDIGDLEFCIEDENCSADRGYRIAEDEYVRHRRSSVQSRISVQSRTSAQDGLLRRNSTATTASSRHDGRMSQKIYMTNEDLTIAVAGFRTGHVRFAAYIFLCIASCGIAFLLFRWLPRWYVGLVGRPCSLGECDWVVVENQWNELVILPVIMQTYGRPVSSVFGPPEKTFAYGLDDEESDPLLDILRTLDYRYVRLCYHPLKGKFVMSTGWRDPAWTNVRAVRPGLNSEEKAMRKVIFGNNLIDIEQKPMGQLLLDEAGLHGREGRSLCSMLTELAGAAPFLYLPDSQPSTLVRGLLLLLCYLHFYHLCW